MYNQLYFFILMSNYIFLIIDVIFYITFVNDKSLNMIIKKKII